jgi:hypothetical protein
VLHLSGFHSLMTTTPRCRNERIYDYENTPAAAAIEAATGTFTAFLGTMPFSHSDDLRGTQSWG